MADLHRWHRSKTLKEENNHYGNNIIFWDIFWDIVFDTVYWPRDYQSKSNIGFSEMERVSKNYQEQLSSPMKWQDNAAHDAK